MSKDLKTVIMEIGKAVLVAVLPYLASAVVKNIGGFQAWLIRIIIKYGGREAIAVIDNAIRYHDREVAQAKAKEELDKVKLDPNSTPEQIGKAYEDYFNAGRLP